MATSIGSPCGALASAQVGAVRSLTVRTVTGTSMSRVAPLWSVTRTRSVRSPACESFGVYEMVPCLSTLPSPPTTANSNPSRTPSSGAMVTGSPTCASVRVG